MNTRYTHGISAPDDLGIPLRCTGNTVTVIAIPSCYVGNKISKSVIKDCFLANKIEC